MINFGELGELIKTRRSIRKFQEKPVPEDLLLKALELATWAPNGGNYQPWRFLIVTNKDLINQMADAVKAKTELIASWPEAAQFGEVVERWRKASDFFRGAPACIAVLMGKYSSIADQVLRARGENDPLAREIRSYRQLGNSSLQSVAAAVTYLLLVLHYFGLGAIWMAGPQQAKKEIEQLLGVTPEWDFVDLIPVGYTAETPKTPPRKAITEVVQFFRSEGEKKNDGGF
ncbi:MAG: nitroreductase family protein [Thermodesulfobacteriota bacterium]|nr:nitroreductase family protein [Thermodesulfobacteriota bacterium]